MITLITFIFFALGLVIGSFLNVVILRLHTRKSFGGRSACMSCRHPLSWWELIPVFSYVGLLGRCKNCKTKISIQYPIVELTVGIIFAVLFLKFQNLFFVSEYGFAASYTFYVTFFSLLVVGATYDLKHKIIPDAVSIILAVVSFLGLFFFEPSLSFWPYFHMPSLSHFLAGPLAALPFALCWLVSRGKWMGLGDAKLAASLGWILGFPLVFSGLVLSFWLGAGVGLGLMVLSKKFRMRSEVPFAPFLALGAFLAFILNLHLF